MAGVWVTAGAPLESGDGWRVWYSWPTGAFTPRTPSVRTTNGQPKQVTDGAWAPPAPLPGAKRQMAIRELRITGRHARRSLRGDDPRAQHAAVLAHAARSASPTRA